MLAAAPETMTRCPACASARIYPSRLRSPLERVRRALTERQPYRCHACAFRGWSEIHVPVDTADAHPDDLRTGVAAKPITPHDLDGLDQPE
jgi:hypothetical protein